MVLKGEVPRNVLILWAKNQERTWGFRADPQEGTFKDSLLYMFQIDSALATRLLNQDTLGLAYGNASWFDAATEAATSLVRRSTSAAMRAAMSVKCEGGWRRGYKKRRLRASSRTNSPLAPELRDLDLLLELAKQKFAELDSV